MMGPSHFRKVTKVLDTRQKAALVKDNFNKRSNMNTKHKTGA